MKRAEILEAARKCVCGEREREYGRPENNFALIGKLWEAYTGTRYSAKDVAMMLALLKVARIKTGVRVTASLTWPVTPPALARSPRRRRKSRLSTPAFPAALKSRKGGKFALPA